MYQYRRHGNAAVYNKNSSTARTAFAQAAPQVTAALKAAGAS